MQKTEEMEGMEDSREQKGRALITCAECKEPEKRNHARGLCPKCYYRLKKKGELGKHAPSKKEKAEGALTLHIDFSQIPDGQELYETIVYIAQRELRTPEAQAAYILMHEAISIRTGARDA